MSIAQERGPVGAAIVAGLVTGIVVVVLSLSFAVLIFSGTLSPHAGEAIRMVLFTGAVVGAVVSLFGSFAGTIAFPQDKIAPILALMASLIVAGLPAGTSDEVLFATVTMALILATVLTGAVLLGLGLFRLGAFIRFIPYPVIGGFLAGTGLLLVKGSLKVMTGHAPSLDGLAELFAPTSLVRWLPGLIYALVMMAAMRRWKHVATMPVLLAGGVALFHIIRATLGMSVAEAEAGGFILGHLPGGGGGFGLPGLAWGGIDWPVLAAQSGSVATILLVSAIGVLLNSSAIELAAGEDMDLNRELKVAGIANLISGAGGGIIGFHTLGLSSLVMQMGIRSRLVGITSAACCLIMLVAGPEPLALFPKPVLGGLLMFIGLGFLDEWLVESRHRMTMADYGVILMIVGVIGTFGYLPGAMVGIAACVVLFLVNYSRISVTKHILNGAEVSSNVDRSPEATQLLRDHGGRILVLTLQGFMFFGTANKLLTLVVARCEAESGAGDDRVRCVVFDFRRITGMDSSAAMSFVKLRQFAEKRGVTLVFASLPAEIHTVLGQSGFSGGIWRLAPDLDHALESCENEVLAGLAGDAVDEPDSIMDELDRRIADFAEPMSLEAGAVLLHQGAVADDLYILEKGRVTVQIIGDDGKPIRLRSMHAGTVVGEMGLYLGEVRSASVVAEQSCTAYRLSAEGLARMERDAPDLASAFHRLMARRLAERLLHTNRMIGALQA
jgi:sulfate permease, SulP family